MKKPLFLTIFLLIFPWLLGANEIEDESAKLASSLADSIAKYSSKKVSVLDFTNLQGDVSEFGRYFAEQLSVLLVNSSKGFAVMDRANLNSLLDEHQLTAQGLVNPDNAKKLGQFAGVDAIVLGTITEFPDTLTLTAKIIATETAQIFGAKSISIPRSKNINTLMQVRSVKKPNERSSGNRTARSKDFEGTEGMSRFEEIEIEIVSVRSSDKQKMIVLLKITNQLENEISICLNERGNFMICENGAELDYSSMAGLNYIQTGYLGDPIQQLQRAPIDPMILQNALGCMTKMSSGESIMVTIEFSAAMSRSIRPPIRLHAGFIVTPNPEANSPRFRLRNVVIDGITPK